MNANGRESEKNHTHSFTTKEHKERKNGKDLMTCLSIVVFVFFGGESNAGCLIRVHSRSFAVPHLSLGGGAPVGTTGGNVAIRHASQDPAPMPIRAAITAATRTSAARAPVPLQHAQLTEQGSSSRG